MKKVIYFLSVTALATLGIVGCKKNQGQPIQDLVQNEKFAGTTIDSIKGLEKNGAVLRFRTVEDYVSFIEDSVEYDKWQRMRDYTAGLGFQNYFVQNPITNPDDSTNMDEDFGCLLNGDGVVVLGDYAVCIDLPNESVYVTPFADLASNYSDFIAGKTSNKDVLAFSTDDDVIDYLLTGDLELDMYGRSTRQNIVDKTKFKRTRVDKDGSFLNFVLLRHAI